MMASGLYIRLYTTALNDPRLCSVSDLAFRTYTRGLMLAKEHGDNGMFPIGALPLVGVFRDPKRMAKARQELLDCGLWEASSDGKSIGVANGKWADYQSTETDAKSLRDKRSESGRKGAKARWSDGKTDGKGDGKPDGKTDGKTFCHMANDGNREEKRLHETSPEHTTQPVSEAGQTPSDHQPPTAADRVNGHAIPHDPAAVTQAHLHAIRSDIRDQFDRLPENRRTKRARFEKSMAAAQARSGRSFAAIGDALLAYYASPVGQTRWARDATRFLDDDGFEEPPSAWERSCEEPKSSGSNAWVNPYPDDEQDFNAEANERARQEQNR